jgi:hypothetical protein
LPDGFRIFEEALEGQLGFQGCFKFVSWRAQRLDVSRQDLFVAGDLTHTGGVEEQLPLVGSDVLLCAVPRVDEPPRTSGDGIKTIRTIMIRSKPIFFQTFMKYINLLIMRR